MKNQLYIDLEIGLKRLTHRFLMINEEPPIYKAYYIITLTIRHLLTECQRFEQDKLILNMSESLNATLGHNLEQNKKILNFLNEEI